VKKPLQVAIVGFVLLAPAFVLVSTGLLDRDASLPTALVHPVVVMGGLLLAFTSSWRASSRVD